MKNQGKIMNYFTKPIISMLFVSQIFAIAGFGLYGDYDLLKYDGNVIKPTNGCSFSIK